MSTRAIVPIKLSLTEGDFYTLWAPKWRQNGAEWQAFLGNEETVLLFNSPEELLCFIESDIKHDLQTHPEWPEFNAKDATRVVPVDRDIYDLIGLPAKLAERPGHEAVSTVARNFELAESLAHVSGAEQAVIFFATHSILRNTTRGADHYSGPEGLKEWSGVGQVVLHNWEAVVTNLDANTRVAEPVADSAQQEDASRRIADATAAAELRRKEEEERRKAAKEAADPYDLSPWAAAGIDPVKITINSQSTYTLRTYVNRKPVFLGKWGEIFTFPTSKQLVRWIMENDDHDLARVSTWPDLVTAANAGELEVEVHPDNLYSFNGVATAIEKGPEAVDTDQLGRCYELCADAADWAGDDSINSFMLANERFQDYLSYMLGSTDHAGYVPSKPYSDHVAAWKSLEDMLVKRFSKF
ncbi:hypothetical protein CPHO_09855 [Corynebacterium phocae]|uniref:Primosomal protein n=1 Tax=Corynebacterium phocae TaxID=161895 RepID=A0A1L7D572_9CORY|nr:hypothetical protein [Corynebacterium phocae]APT93143.1 hypothetical protein CPHO_09855 [Corynebacterium phocae]KAA8722219.1 hypothetical protein F4V58_09330 [Corynebacterium phocae]